MGYLDRILGKRSKDAPGGDEAGQAQHLDDHQTTSSAPAVPEIVHEHTSSAGSPSFGPPSISASAIPPSSPALAAMNPSFVSGVGAGGASPSQRLYDPYEGINQVGSHALGVCMPPCMHQQHWPSGM